VSQATASIEVTDAGILKGLEVQYRWIPKITLKYDVT